MSSISTTTRPTAVDVAALVEDVVRERVGIFAEFFRPLLHDFASRLAASLSAAPRAAFVCVPDVVRTALVDLTDPLMMLHLKTLIVEFHAHREAMGLPFTPDSSYAFEEFQAHLSHPDAAAVLYADHPVLVELVERTLRQRQALLLEVTDHFIADARELSQHQLISQARIAEIHVPDGGDSHNGGRVVTFLRTPGEQIVYKPRSMATETLTADLVSLINPHLDPSASLELPRSLDMDSHGWQQKISPRPVASLTGARRYAYRLGAFTALFAAIGATDLHCENVLAAGEHPMFIDLETLVGVRYRSSDGDTPPLSATPVITTGLIPFFQPGASVDIDISGAGNRSEQESRLTSTMLVDKGTDATRLENLPVVMQHTTNLLTLGSEPADLGDLSSDFDAGLRDSIAAIRAEVRGIKKSIRRKFVIRQVLRPTAVYARFLEASLHPRYLKDPAERRRLFSLMKPLRLIAEGTRDQLRALEQAALVSGDVPYFSVDAHATAAFSPDLGSVDGVFHCSPSEEIAAAVDHFLATPELQHRYLCHVAIRGGDAVSDGEDDRPRQGDFGTDLWVGDVTSFATRTADLVEELNVGRRGAPAWLLPGVTPHGSVSLMPMSAHLYDGGGVLLALAASAKPTHRKLAAEATRGGLLETLPGTDTALGLSVFSGQPSAAYLAWELDQAGVPGLDSLPSQILAGVASVHLSDTHVRDLLGGLAGTAAWVASVPALALDQADLLERGIAQMLDVLRNDDLPAHEMAHGRMGVAWALARVAKRVGDESALRMAANHLHRAAELWTTTEQPHVAKVAHASWCKGTAGALIALGEGLVAAGRSVEEVRLITDPLVDQSVRAAHGRGRDMTPCHGVSGVVQALAHASSTLHVPAYLDAARRLFTDRMSRVSAEGYNGGLRRSQGHLGYMTGLTGVAHTAALLADRRLGVPLALTATPMLVGGDNS